MKKRIGLFVGGSTDQNLSDEYKNAAILLGKKMNERKYTIIFDGCHGLPCLAYQQLDDCNDGLIIYDDYYQKPDFEKILSYPGITLFYGPQIRSLDKQSDVTRALINAGDALFFMKGGMGTIAEIVQAIDRKRNQEHDKPIVILNLNHSWDELVALLDSYNLKDLYYVTDNVIDGLNYIEKELYDKKSKFYCNYLKYGSVCERDYPIIEELPNKKNPILKKEKSIVSI